MNHAQAINDLIVRLGGSYTGATLPDFDATTHEGQDVLAGLKDRNVFLTSSVMGMKTISHVIEDQAISQNRPVRFYSAFQKYSRARFQERRYSRLLDTGSTVFLIGEPDTDLRTNPAWQRPTLHFAALPPAPTLTDGQPPTGLNTNWLVVLHDPELVSMALVSHEIPNPLRPTNAPDKLIYRTFEGFWTYDKEVIGYVVTILDDYIASLAPVPA